MSGCHSIHSIHLYHKGTWFGGISNWITGICRFAKRWVKLVNWASVRTSTRNWPFHTGEGNGQRGTMAPHTLKRRFLGLLLAEVQRHIDFVGGSHFDHEIKEQIPNRLEDDVLHVSRNDSRHVWVSETGDGQSILPSHVVQCILSKTTISSSCLWLFFDVLSAWTNSCHCHFKSF